MVRCIRICHACERRFISVMGLLKCDPCMETVEEEDDDEEPLLKLLEKEQRKGSTQDDCIDLVSDNDDDNGKLKNDVNVNSSSDGKIECVDDEEDNGEIKNDIKFGEEIDGKIECVDDEQDELNDKDKPDNDDEEDEVGDEDDDILADFQEEEDSASTGFQAHQEHLHASTALVQDVAVGPTGTTTNTDLMMCLACGASLSHIKSGYKGRLNHIKRCSKSRGVTVKDVRMDDCLDDDAEPTSSPLAAKRWHDGSTTVESKPKARTLHDMLMAGARRAAKTEQIKKQAKESRKRTKFTGGGGIFGKRSYTSCPSFKKIPGTDFICDGFQYADPALTSNYFLTHFHSDHYGGIDKHWCAGTIYCSLSTANLVHEQLSVDKKYLHPLPMNEPTIVESRGAAVSITLLNANHCPGAIMFLFEVKQRTILHVGDFRWNYNIMSEQALLKPFCRKPWTNETSARRLDELFLDTTYCDAKYDLPTQAECIAGAIAKAVQEVEEAKCQKQRLLMLFGAYTIGKEAVRETRRRFEETHDTNHMQVYMSVAKRLGMKVYVDKRRHKVLSALDWPKEDAAMLTTNPADTIIWVAPLGHINMKKMPPYQYIRKRGFSRDFDKVVGFRPTGCESLAVLCDTN